MKMVEILPKNMQEKVAEHLQEYIADLADEKKWDASFDKAQTELSNVVREVRKNISKGKSEPFNYDKL